MLHWPTNFMLTLKQYGRISSSLIFSQIFYTTFFVVLSSLFYFYEEKKNCQGVVEKLIDRKLIAIN